MDKFNIDNIELTQIVLETVNDLNLPDSLPIGEFLNYPEEGRTYEVPDNNTLIEELIEIYKQPCIDDGDIDDSVEPPTVNANDACKWFRNCSFISAATTRL